MLHDVWKSLWRSMRLRVDVDFSCVWVAGESTCWELFIWLNIFGCYTIFTKRGWKWSSYVLNLISTPVRGKACFFDYRHFCEIFQWFTWNRWVTHLQSYIIVYLHKHISITVWAEWQNIHHTDLFSYNNLFMGWLYFIHYIYFHMVSNFLMLNHAC